ELLSQCSQPNSPPGKSNTKKRVAIGLLIFLLVLAIILIVIAWHIPEWTNALQTASNSTETAITPTTTPTSTNTKKTTTSGATSCPLKLPCDTGWKLNGTKCYHFSTTKSSWNQSRDECKEKRGYLVKIDSREEQRFLFYEVRELMNKRDDSEDKFWIGLTDAKKEGEWIWIDDTPLNQSLSFWFKGDKVEPDNWTDNDTKPEGEDCVRMGEMGTDFVEKCWFDKHCKAEQRFICEKEANKSPDCQNK
uniref:C-type lectin domain-containing protein n=1 Tax=Neogobius melanostomus TaxID=47308 RepID=A0A8C6ST14_9GOBI